METTVKNVAIQSTENKIIAIDNAPIEKAAEVPQTPAQPIEEPYAVYAVTNWSSNEFAKVKNLFRHVISTTDESLIKGAKAVISDIDSVLGIAEKYGKQIFKVK